MIAVDWGTTSLRAYRLGADGEVLDARSAAKGILTVGPGGFEQALEEAIAGWRSDKPIVMSGMVGSRQGWAEVPYVSCPAGFAEVAKGMREVRPGTWIVPGVVCREGVPDVMRGEETQLLGSGVRDGVVCLPGTHSKWVEMRNGAIERFSTHMTGELYALLSQHSILARMMEPGSFDPRAFREGVERSGERGGLLHHLFGVRTRALMGELGAGASAAYLSGILVGHELRAQRAQDFGLIGAAELTQLYEAAASALGLTARPLDAHAAARGLFLLGGMLR